jgi:hypothetical protein
MGPYRAIIFHREQGDLVIHYALVAVLLRLPSCPNNVWATDFAPRREGTSVSIAIRSCDSKSWLRSESIARRH